jgi:hypothetical protein
MQALAQLCVDSRENELKEPVGFLKRDAKASDFLIVFRDDLPCFGWRDSGAWKSFAAGFSRRLITRLDNGDDVVRNAERRTVPVAAVWEAIRVDSLIM